MAAILANFILIIGSAILYTNISLAYTFGLPIFLWMGILDTSIIMVHLIRFFHTPRRRTGMKVRLSDENHTPEKETK